MLEKIASALLAGVLAGCTLPKNLVYETGLSTGGGWGNKRSRTVVPVNAHFGVDANNIIGMDRCFGTLQIGAEAFEHTFIEEEGVLVGAGPYIKYTSPLLKTYSYSFYRPKSFLDRSHLGMYAEIGSAPSYLSIRTREQGQAGFNFVQQIGTGIESICDNGMYFQFGYRFSHTSHGHLRDVPNKGIDVHMFILGLGLRF